MGVGDGQGGLACCSPWGCKESDMTEWLNWTDIPTGHFSSLVTGFHINVYKTERYNWANVVQSLSRVPILCNTMDCNTPGFPVHHQLPELAQTHVYWVSDATQPSYPQSSPSPPAFNLFQHKSHFKWVNSSHQLAKVLEFQLSISPSSKYSGLISFRMDSLQSKGLSRVFSNTTVQKHRFFGSQLSFWFNSHIHTWLLEKP